MVVSLSCQRYERFYEVISVCFRPCALGSNGATGIDANDSQPPIYLAASIERGAVKDEMLRLKSSRMIVVSNPWLLEPDLNVRSNFYFVYNSLKGILDRDELLGIQPKRKIAAPVHIHPSQHATIFRILAFFFPGAVLAFRFFVWAARRA